MPSRGRFVRPLAGAGRVRRGLHRAHWRQDHARCAGQRAGAQQEVGRYDGEVNYWPCDLRMTHRGACSADNDSGDGAGALLGIPHSFYVETLKYDLFFLLFTFHSFNWKCFLAREESNIDLPSKGRYGTGIIFMDPDTTESCRFVDNDNVMAVWLPALALVNNIHTIIPIQREVLRVGSLARTLGAGVEKPATWQQMSRYAACLDYIDTCLGYIDTCINCHVSRCGGAGLRARHQPGVRGAPRRESRHGGGQQEDVPAAEARHPQHPRAGS